jgi:hypothetical protein
VVLGARPRGIRGPAHPQGSEDSFNLQVVHAGKFTTVATLKGLPAGAEYTLGHFRGAPTPEFLFYKPGDATLIVRPVEAVEAGQVRFGDPAKFDLGGPIRRVITLAPAKRQLFVVFGNGEKAGVFAFDGRQAPRWCNCRGHPQVITCALPTAGGMIVFSEPATSKFSTRYQMYKRRTENMSPACSAAAKPGGQRQPHNPRHPRPDRGEKQSPSRRR